MVKAIEKRIVILIAVISILCSGFLVYSLTNVTLVEKAEELENQSFKSIVRVKARAKKPKSDENGIYLLWEDNKLVDSYSDTEALKTYVAKTRGSYITKKGNAKPIFENDKQYIVKTLTYTKQYGDINEALFYARAKKNLESRVYFEANNKIIWSYDDVIKNNVQINVAHISQKPELINGSEVTSLTMLLTASGVNVDKLEIGKALKIDSSEKVVDNFQKYWGSPYYGYVGDMYNKSESLGVYSQIIFDLLQYYIYDYAVNLTGCNYSLVERFLSQGYPVWVMTTETFKELPKSSFEIIKTNFGEVYATTKSQAVLVTGYDSIFVYIKDPNGNVEKVSREDFIKSFNQMGNQAISYVVK